MSIPRQEYPRPQFRRAGWINLNGAWDFRVDQGNRGIECEFFKEEQFSEKIIVPFCPESELSGIANKDFMACVWYKRKLTIPSEFEGKEIILHFGAVDYHAHVYVNGVLAGEHKGGYSSFSLNITKLLKAGENDLTVCAEDDTRSGAQPSGKQSTQFKSYGCFYTRTTGIWQTVWLEAVEKSHLLSVNYLSDPENAEVTVQVKASPSSIGKKLSVRVKWDGKEVGARETIVRNNPTTLSLKLSEKHLWDLGVGNLYDTELILSDDETEYDRVESYFGLRSVALGEKAFYLNGRSVFGRWVLDQGFYPDGIYTAPNDEALKADIESSMQLGFNGARLHEKMFEPRFLYWADRLGYMVWGEHANWGQDYTDSANLENFLPEWIEGMERDMAHPSIIGWCPLNETWDWCNRRQSDGFVETIYRVTKAIDPSRPVIDTSGNFHVATDIFDVHDYEQDTEKFASYYEKLNEGIVNDQIERNVFTKDRQVYRGEPFFISEYGGIRWNMTEDQEAWGYGEAPKTEEEFLERYEKLTTSILDNPNIFAFCYTQLYDVEQEVNGLMTYDRKFKFDPSVIAKINSKKAAIEE